LGDGRCRCLERIGAALAGRELVTRLGRPGQKLGIGLALEAPLRVCDPLELGLDLLEPVWLRLESVQEPPELERRLP
jgi:hypothetical protein